MGRAVIGGGGGGGLEFLPGPFLIPNGDEKLFFHSRIGWK